MNEKKNNERAYSIHRSACSRTRAYTQIHTFFALILLFYCWNVCLFRRVHFLIIRD